MPRYCCALLGQSDQLQTTRVFVVRGHKDEAYVWVGHNARPGASKEAEDVARRELCGAGATVVHEGHEPVVFKEKFRQWKRP